MEYRPYRTPRKYGPRITAIGGGHGLSNMLRGLKDYTENLSAIVTVADDGGGSGALRQDLGMPPPGDIRNCLVALANTEPLMKQMMDYRFQEGRLAGQGFGNLFLAALNGISPSFDSAVRRMSEVLAITGRVLPVTTADVQLEAEFENGASVIGESKISYCKKKEDCRITKVRLLPERPKALPEAPAAIQEADMIVLAGFLSILSGEFVKRWPERILNVHPALIPSFCGKGAYGLHVHEQALAYGVKVSGATVHFVTEECDAGPIILQKAVDVLLDDTPETLQRRIMEQCEWKLLPQAVSLFCQDRLRVEGRTVKILDV